MLTISQVGSEITNQDILELIIVYAYEWLKWWKEQVLDDDQKYQEFQKIIGLPVDWSEPKSIWRLCHKSLLQKDARSMDVAHLTGLVAVRIIEASSEIPAFQTAIITSTKH